MDVLILSIGDDTIAIDAAGSTTTTVEQLVAQVADLAHAEVRYAVIEAVPVDEFGPGDLARALSQGSDDIPVSTWRKCSPR